jgi:hypothetical protein
MHKSVKKGEARNWCICKELYQKSDFELDEKKALANDGLIYRMKRQKLRGYLGPFMFGTDSILLVLCIINHDIKFPKREIRVTKTSNFHCASTDRRRHARQNANLSRS